MRLDKNGRVIIKLTNTALSSLEQAVRTVGHELEHMRQFLVNGPRVDAAARAAEEPFFQLFLKRLRNQVLGD
jgi:hypothetical protein